MKTKAFTLMEVMVASLIIALSMFAFISGYTGYKRLSSTLDYRYTAVNLAREALEWAEAGRLPHPLGIKYMYAPGTDCATDFNIPNANSDLCIYIWQGKNTASGYGLKKWSHYDVSLAGNTTPFTWWGGLKNDPTDPSDDTPDFAGNRGLAKRGLVPKSDPNSVKITFVARKWPLLLANIYPPTYQTDVKIEWTENGKQFKEYLGTIPLRSINDQLKLNTSSLQW